MQQNARYTLYSIPPFGWARSCVDLVEFLGTVDINNSKICSLWNGNRKIQITYPSGTRCFGIIDFHGFNCLCESITGRVAKYMCVLKCTGKFSPFTSKLYQSEVRFYWHFYLDPNDQNLSTHTTSQESTGINRSVRRGVLLNTSLDWNHYFHGFNCLCKEIIGSFWKQVWTESIKHTNKAFQFSCKIYSEGPTFAGFFFEDWPWTLLASRDSTRS